MPDIRGTPDTWAPGFYVGHVRTDENNKEWYYAKEEWKPVPGQQPALEAAGICSACGRNRLEREPHLIDCIAYRKTREARESVVKSTVGLSDCADEFEGNLEICGEYLNELYDAVTRLKKAEESSADR